MKIKVVPTYHPAYILRSWSDRMLCVQDLRRAAKYKDGIPYPSLNWRFTIRPSFSAVMNCLTALLETCNTKPLWIDFDLETKHGHIDCAGLSWSLVDAICIPFMSKENKAGYWSVEEEASIIFLLCKLLQHPNCLVRGQNLLYDSQYTYRHWHMIPNVKQDTMISMHVMFAGMKKSLDFQASLFCDFYSQWKPDKAQWAEGK